MWQKSDIFYRKLIENKIQIQNPINATIWLHP